MASDEIGELRAAFAELRRDMQSMTQATHATLHLLAYIYTMRCLAEPEPMAAYKNIASILLESLGAAGEAELPTYGDEKRDAVARGMRHHVGQFLLTLRAHIDANLETSEGTVR